MKSVLPVCMQLAIVLMLACSSDCAAQEQKAKEKRVLIIGMDGTRVDALRKASTPNMDQLKATGAYSETVQILGERYQKNNTISGPSWSSILTGVWADKHGVHDNSFKGRNFELFPHFFKHLKNANHDAHTISMVSWPPIHDFIVSEADVSVVEAMQPSKNQIADLRTSADDLETNTRNGEWHHLLATRKGGVLELYLDGKRAGTLNTAADSYLLEGDSLYIGRDTRDSGVTFEGELDDIRVWNRALAPQEILALSAPGRTGSKERDGLVLELTFEGSKGSEASGKNRQNFLMDTANHSSGPNHAKPASDSTQFEIIAEEGSSGPNNVLRLSGNAKGSGLLIPMTDALRKVTEGDFTVEIRFKTQNEGRAILIGNYKAGIGALNLELHQANSIRAYVQPTEVKPSNGLQREQARDEVMAANAARILKETNPDAMFVYFHQVDATGHTLGFSPDVPEYVASIENVDRHIGTVVKAMQARSNFKNEDWLVIVCTDHGGYLKGHGDGHDKPEIREVFLILSGPSTRVGPIQQQAYLVDVAVTALTHLVGPVDERLQLDGKAVGLK